MRTTFHRSRIAEVARAAVPVALIASVIATVLRFPPSQYGFYPHCPFHAAFGLLCPGCGATRALAALLQGNLREAVHLNAFATALMPFVVAYGIATYLNFVTRWPLRLPQPPPSAIYATLAAAALFTITRNLHASSF